MIKNIQIKGKRILVFIPSGINGRVGSALYKELEASGAFVKMFPERPSLSTIGKVFTRIFKNILPIGFNIYINKIIEECKDENFDYILVIRGEAFTRKTIHLLRKRYPTAKFILYLWDILATNDKSSIIDSFDKALSFDSGDCLQYPKLYFRPLFFLPSHTTIMKEQNKEFDILFAGTMHSIRYKILENVKRKYSSELKLNFYYFLPSRLLFFKSIINGNFPVFSKIKEFKFIMMSEQELHKAMAFSKAIIDIAHPKQESLSLRSLEALGSKTKLITDFDEIKYYDFYNPNNILIINHKDIKIKKDFLNSPFDNIEADILEKYTLTSWLNDVLFFEREKKYYYK